MPRTPEQTKAIATVVEKAFDSGMIDRKLTLYEVSKQFGSDIDEVAGYVVAWDRYVLVVSAQANDEIIFRR